MITAGPTIDLRAPPRGLVIAPRVPGSKSITNRALVLAAIAAGRSRIEGWLDAEDTRLMLAALRSVGVAIEGGPEAPERAIAIEGHNGPLRAVDAPPLFAGTAGTVARFLLAIVAASPGRFVLDGTPRMRERPMAGLVDALCDRGAVLQPLGLPGALPLQCGPHAHRLRGGTVTLQRPASSQFVSALVLAALLADSPTTIVLREGTPARPYVEMTLAMVRSFGGDARFVDDATLQIHPRTLQAQHYVVEPDASAASYFLTLAAIYGGRCSLAALGRDSLQGDAGFAHVLARMGAEVEQDGENTTVRGTGTLRGGDFDLADMPDMTLTLAVAALFAEGPTRIDGVGILRHHESDRLAAAATELRKLGATVQELPEGLHIVPPAAGRPHAGVAIDTYADHRMAMAFAMVGDVTIRDPACVAKTFPGYFDELARIGMTPGRDPAGTQ
ncbi:MAG: 3-phosphoshikimate 1-carboxyvinyltransferase [Nannocystaceae bacterium]|nr:3-phosphoshikimate 1-carboxyvinyltransferase [Nannocystaceae bacterium]